MVTFPNTILITCFRFSFGSSGKTEIEDWDLVCIGTVDGALALDFGRPEKLPEEVTEWLEVWVNINRIEGVVIVLTSVSGKVSSHTLVSISDFG